MCERLNPARHVSASRWQVWGGEVVAFDGEGRSAWTLQLQGEVRAFGTDGDLSFVGTRPGDLYTVRLSKD